LRIIIRITMVIIRTVIVIWGMIIMPWLIRLTGLSLYTTSPKEVARTAPSEAVCGPEQALIIFGRHKQRAGWERAQAISAG
jgi:hypothetical protein